MATEDGLHEYKVTTHSYQKAIPLDEHIVYANYITVGDEYGALKLYVYDNMAPGGSRVAMAFSSWEMVEDLSLKAKG